MLRDAKRAALLSGRRGVRRNDVIAVILIAVVAAAAVPLGSNRPALWAVFDALVFLVLLAQTIMRVFDRDGRDRLLPRDPALIGLFVVVAAWQAAQLLPLGPLVRTLGNGPGAYGETISLVPGQSVLMLLNFLTYGAVFVLAFQVGQRPSRARRMFAGAGLVVAAFALHALYGYASGDNALLGGPREFYVEDAAGTFVNRNSFATFLGLGLILNTGLVASALFGSASEPSRVRWTPALLHATAVAMLVAGLFATHSRMGLTAALLGAAVTFVLVAPRSGGAIGLRLAVAALAVFGAGVLAVLFGQGLFERLGSSQSSLDVRMDLYAQVWKLILVRPLTGFGAGTFEAAFPLVHHLPVSPDLVWDRAHDTYLTLLAELGLGTGALAILIVPVLARHFAGALARGTSSRLGAAVALGATVQVGLHSLVDFSLEIHAVALFFAFLLGLGLATVATGGHR